MFKQKYSSANQNFKPFHVSKNAASDKIQKFATNRECFIGQKEILILGSGQKSKKTLAEISSNYVKEKQKEKLREKQREKSQEEVTSFLKRPALLRQSGNNVSAQNSIKILKFSDQPWQTGFRILNNEKCQNPCRQKTLYEMANLTENRKPQLLRDKGTQDLDIKKSNLFQKPPLINNQRTPISRNKENSTPKKQIHFRNVQSNKSQFLKNETPSVNKHCQQPSIIFSPKIFHSQIQSNKQSNDRPLSFSSFIEPHPTQFRNFKKGHKRQSTSSSNTHTEYRLCINCEGYVNKTMTMQHQKKCTGFKILLKMSNDEFIDFLSEKIEKRLKQLKQLRQLIAQQTKQTRKANFLFKINKVDQIITDLDLIRLKALKKLDVNMNRCQMSQVTEFSFDNSSFPSFSYDNIWSEQIDSFESYLK